MIDFEPISSLPDFSTPLWRSRNLRFVGHTSISPCMDGSKKRVGKRGEKPVMGYYNLGETVDPKTDKVNEYSLDYIEKELQIRNWATVRNNDNSLSFIRSEERAFNGQRCVTFDASTTRSSPVQNIFDLFLLPHR